MDSLSIYKGYGKVDHLESAQNPPPSHHYGRRSAVIITVSSLLLLSLILISLIGVFLHKSADSDSADPIRYACKVTQHQDTCFTSIAAINRHPRPDPVSILSILLRSTISELRSHLSLPKRLISEAKDRRSVSALEDCGGLLNDAFRSLNRTSEKLSGNEELTEKELSDVRTWISAAMTDLETCVDGLEETESTAVGEVRRAVQGSTVGMSDSLAILANLDELKRIMLKMCRPSKSSASDRD